jgi:hypothetical protein
MTSTTTLMFGIGGIFVVWNYNFKFAYYDNGKVHVYNKSANTFLWDKKEYSPNTWKESKEYKELGVKKKAILCSF